MVYVVSISLPLPDDVSSYILHRLGQYDLVVISVLTLSYILHRLD